MLPIQKNTYAEKTARKKNPDGSYRTWGMDTVDYYRDQFKVNNVQAEVDEIQYAIEGIINRDKFDHLLNPHGLTAPKKGVQLGATLKNHNLLKGVANLLVGEFGRRTHDYVVTSMHKDDQNTYLQGLSEKMRAYDEQETVNKLNEAGFPTNQPTVEQPPRREVEETYKQTYNEIRVLRGQDAIDFIRHDQELEDKFTDIYYDWITVGMGYSYKCVRNNDVNYEYVPIRELFIPYEHNLRMAEDAQFAVRRRVVPINQILDAYSDSLDEEDLDYIHENHSQDSGIFANANTVNTGEKGVMPHYGASSQYSHNNSANGLTVDHVVWRSWKKYGILTYTNPLGEIATMEVADDYVKNADLGDISIEWKWETSIWEGTCIADRIYTLVRELPENRSSLDNAGIQKLPYNGLVNRSKSGTIQSIFKDGLPYQILMDTLHFQLEKVINKNKDKLIVMPYGLVPRNQGIDTTTMMHHADASGILWVDETAPNASYAAQMIKVLDVSLGNYVKDVYEIMQMIKQAYWDSIGMNNQRFSDIAQGAGKGTTEQAIARSAIITYEMTRKMDKFIQREYTGLMDISKLAWINGKKGLYLLSDGSKKFLQLNEDDAIYHLESDYGILVKDSAEQTEALQQFRGLASAYAQQNNALTATAEIYTNQNLDKIKGIVKVIEENEKKHQLALAETNGKQQQELQAMVDANDAENRKVEQYKSDNQLEGVMYTADMKANSNNSRDEPRPSNEVEQALAYHKIDKDNNAEMQAERKLNQEDRNLQLKQRGLEIQAKKNAQQKTSK